MKYAIAFAGIMAVASAQFGQPQFGAIPRPNSPPRGPPVRAGNDANANVLRYSNDIGPDGSYNYIVEIDNGINAQAQGVPRAVAGNPPQTPVVATGSFGWTSPEGVPVSISYIADENGYQPSGDALPTPPPIPDAILKALDFISRNPPKK